MKTLYLVKSNPAPGREDDFNRWYSNVHLPEVMKIEGFLSAERFVTTDVQVQAQQTRYLAIYEIDSGDVKGTLQNLKEATWLQMSDAIDLSSLEISIFRSLD